MVGAVSNLPFCGEVGICVQYIRNLGRSASSKNHFLLPTPSADRDLKKFGLKTLVGSQIQVDQAFRGPNKRDSSLDKSGANLIEMK